MATTRHPDVQAREVVEAACFQRDPADGWHYPAAPEISLVRICVFGGQYRVERRRRVTSEWLPIVTADTSEFDPVAFQSWKAHWPLIAASA